MNGRWVTLGVVMMVVSVACGGGGDDDVSTTSTPTVTTVVDGTTTSAPEASTTSTTRCTDDALAGGRVSTVGFDDITFGMTVADAEEATGVCLRADRPANRECYLVVPVPGPEGISFLVTDGTIERVDVFGGDTTTRSGLGLGTTEAELMEQLGAGLEVRPHPQGGGNELVFVPTDEGDADFRVIFETNGERVTRFRSGRVPQVDDPLPCPGGAAPTGDDAPPVSSG